MGVWISVVTVNNNNNKPYLLVYFLSISLLFEFTTQVTDARPEIKHIISAIILWLVRRFYQLQLRLQERYESNESLYRVRR